MPLSRAGQVSAQVPNWVVDHKGRTSPGAAGARHRGDLCLPAFRSVNPRGHTHTFSATQLARQSALAFQLGGHSAEAHQLLSPPRSSRCDRQALLVFSISGRGHPRGRGNCPSVPSSPSPHPQQRILTPTKRDAGRAPQNTSPGLPRPAFASLALG